jgi:hypothetical protein
MAESIEKKSILNKRSCACGCLTIILLTLLTIIGLALWPKHHMARAEERLTASGRSLDWWDYNPPRLRDEENGTPLLDMIAAVLKPNQDNIKNIKDEFNERTKGKGTLSPKDISFLREKIAPYDEIYELLDQIDNYTSASNHVSTCEQLAIPTVFLQRWYYDYLLQFRALIAAHEGRIEDAYHDVLRSFHLANLVSMEQSNIISALFALSIAGNTTDGGFRLLHIAPPSTNERKKILQEIAALKDSGFVHRSLEADRIVMYLYMKNVLQELGFKKIFAYQSFCLDAAACLDDVPESLQLLRKPSYLTGEELSAIEEKKKYFHSTDAKILFGSDMCGSIQKHRDMCYAKLDMLIIAFLLEDYHTEQGQYPNDLGALRGVPSPDPFSGMPYNYKKIENGYQIYSIGPDMVDDGGTPQSPLSTIDAPGDLVWKMEKAQ